MTLQMWRSIQINYEYFLAKKVSIHPKYYLFCVWKELFHFFESVQWMQFNKWINKQNGPQTEKWSPRTWEKIERRLSANHFFIDFNSLSSSFFAHLAPSNFFEADKFNVMIEHADSDSSIPIRVWFVDVIRPFDLFPAINQTENNTNRKLSNNFYWHLIDLVSDFR